MIIKTIRSRNNTVEKIRKKYELPNQAFFNHHYIMNIELAIFQCGKITTNIKIIFSCNQWSG